MYMRTLVLDSKDLLHTHVLVKVHCDWDLRRLRLGASNQHMPVDLPGLDCRPRQVDVQQSFQAQRPGFKHAATLRNLS
jgi:hypothetical protein